MPFPEVKHYLSSCCFAFMQNVQKIFLNSQKEKKRKMIPLANRVNSSHGSRDRDDPEDREEFWNNSDKNAKKSSIKGG